MSPDLKTENKNPYSNYSYARKIGKSEKYKSKNHYDKSFSKPKESFKNPYSAGNKKQDDYRDFKE